MSRLYSPSPRPLSIPLLPHRFFAIMSPELARSDGRPLRPMQPVAMNELSANNGLARFRRWMPALILALAVALVYGNAMNGPFFMDDQDNIVLNPAIQRLWPLTAALNPPPGEVTFCTRPFLNLTMCVDYALWKLDVRGYRLTSILFHLGAAWALFGLLNLALRSSGRRESEALLLATSAVNYLSQRTEVAVGFYFFLTLYALHRAAECKTTATPWLALSLFSCLLGMGSKENMAAAPFLALVYDRIFLSPSWKQVFRARGGFYLLLVATLAWPLSRQLAYSPHLPAEVIAQVALRKYYMSQAWGVVRLLSLSIVPRQLVLDYGAAIPYRLADTWFALLILLAMGAALCWTLARHPRTGFAGLCFAALLAPSSVLPIVGQPLAEHRIYAPLAALAALGSLGLYQVLPLLPQRFSAAPHRLKLFAALAFIWALALGWTAHSRNAVYQNAVDLWLDTASKRPSNGRAWHNLGVALNQAERHEEALIAYANADRTLQRWPAMRKAAQSSLILSLVNLDRLPDAFELLEQALAREPDEPIFLHTLGIAHLHDNAPAAARIHLAKALELLPREEPRYRIELARACFETGDADAANDGLRHVWGTSASRPHAYEDLLPYYARTWEMGEKPRALHFFRKLAERESENASVLNNVSWILAVAANSPAPRDEALALALKAVELGGETNPTLLNTLAAAYANAGDYASALSVAETARRLAQEQGMNNLARRLEKRIRIYRKGQPWREKLFM